MDRLFDYAGGVEKLPGWACSCIIAVCAFLVLPVILPAATIGYIYDWLLCKYQERYINEAGYFLRDDRPIRTGVPEFFGREEAYSLFQRKPYGRKAVFAGPHRWAIQQAYEHIKGEENVSSAQ